VAPIQNLRKKKLPISKSSNETKTLTQTLVNQVTKYSYATKKGISLKKNLPPKSKENQDSYISAARFNGLMHTHYFGVCDGHGVNGKIVSSYVKKKLPQFLKDELNKCNLLFPTEVGKYPPSDKFIE
jgi:serine/threonine protein phosphatase PrpC